MKISKSQLKQIIQEELDQVMEEGFFEEWWGDAVGTDKLQSAISGDGEGSDEGGEGPTYVEPGYAAAPSGFSGVYCGH